MRRNGLIPALAFALAAAPAWAIDPIDSDEANLAPARAAVAAGDWAGAVALLTPIVQESPRDADALNLMGYALRKGGNPGQAATFYDAALAADPNHLGALEYQGELLLETGDRAGAEANLGRLRALCGACEEAEDLAAALAGS